VSFVLKKVAVWWFFAVFWEGWGGVKKMDLFFLERDPKASAPSKN
jgi:hypothetical protein